jgi:hypothetical protein
VPREADGVLRLIGRVAGAQFSLLAVRRREEARLEFEALVAQTTKAPELVAIRVVHSLVQAVKASSGSLTLSRNGNTRRVAAIGPTPTEPSLPLASDSLLTPERFVCVLPLGPLGENDRAVLEVRASGGHELTADAAAVAQSCATVLRTWLAGTVSSFDATTVLLDPEVVSVPAFSSRIQEELERAKRFDLRLSLILIEVTASSDAVAQLQDALRRELRGSDVTGAMSGRRVAALLTHTDALGLDNVVRRLKQRLADAAERLNLSDLKLGQAAFSPEMRTAEALLELALRQSEPVIVH